MGSLRVQLAESAFDGASDEPTLQRLPEQELWDSSLVGKQFPELDMLPPFAHSGSELPGWQPPNMSNGFTTRKHCNRMAALVARCLVLLWIAILPVIL